MILVFALWIIFAIVVGGVASGRGHSGILFFLVSLVLSPLVGLLLALLIPTSSAANSGGTAIISTAENEKRWESLSRYDQDIRTAVERLSVHGPEAVKKFREIYFDVHDKSAIPAIVSDIEAEAALGRVTSIVPTGFHKVGERSGVAIYGDGNYFWVDGKYLASLGAAKAYALAVSKKG